MLACPLGLEPCDQKPTLLNANCYAINCENYFYCRSWVLPWALPLHRMKADPDSKVNPVPHDYYLVKFLCGYGYPREGVEGMQERDWAAYFAEYGYAEAVPVPVSRFKELIHYIPRPFPVTFPNGMIIVMTLFDAVITIRRRD